jgi:hypothetical protein
MLYRICRSAIRQILYNTYYAFLEGSIHCLT